MSRFLTLLATVIVAAGCTGGGATETVSVLDEPSASITSIAEEEATAAPTTTEATSTTSEATTTTTAASDTSTTTEAAPTTTEATPITSEATLTPGPEEEIITILIDTYTWGQSQKTVALQEVLGITADGIYGSGTRAAHLVELENRGLSTAGVPENPSSSSPSTTVPSTQVVSVDAEDNRLIAGADYTVEATGFIPGSTVEVELHSDPWSFGTWIADSDGRIAARIQVPPSTIQGQHRIVVRELIKVDQAITRSALRAEIPVDVTIDETPPVLVSASLSPTTVDVTSGSQDVVLTLEITDDVSGAYGMMWSFNGVWSISGCCVDSPQLPNSLQRVSGTTTDGTWQATFPVPAGTPPGPVCLEDWMISDRLNNTSSGEIPDLCFTILNAGG